MKEEKVKNRYIFLFSNLYYDREIKDFISGLKKLIEYDKQIKELSQENQQLKEDLVYEKNFWRENNKINFALYEGLKKENEQLKEQLNNSEQTCLICNKDKENEQLSQRIKELEEELKKYKSYKTDDERIKDLTYLYEKYATENQQLKQQLHDLPKKIVEEIKETNIYLNSSQPNQKNHIYDSYLIDAEKLDTILKKYEVENE